MYEVSSSPCGVKGPVSLPSAGVGLQKHHETVCDSMMHAIGQVRQHMSCIFAAACSVWLALSDFK